MAKKNNPNLYKAEDQRRMIGDGLSFAASEAYKLLRTNLMFSLPDESGCQIIGVTSAMRGEGKSTTAINMAYSMAQTGQRVLLLEADLRLPNIAKRLHIASKPGISNLLAGQCKGSEVLQASGLMENLAVIVAGDTPPNPAELLSSKQMKIVVNSLAKSFDMIVVDLPPVNVVSDALIVSKMISGMVVVVRQDFCDRASLAEVVRKLRFAETKILGFVMTGSNVHKKNYKRYGSDYADYGGKAKKK